MFNATEPVENIKLNLMITTVQTEAPTLWGFFNQFNLLIRLQCSS